MRKGELSSRYGVSVVLLLFLLVGTLLASVPLAVEAHPISQKTEPAENVLSEKILDRDYERSWDTPTSSRLLSLEWDLSDDQLQTSKTSWELRVPLDVNPFGTPHPPIYIDDNSDFETQGWPGEGSVEHPYIIAGLEINATTGVSAINITNTNVHFFIRDCWLTSNSTNVIEIRSVTHVCITNNTFVQGERAIAAYDTTDLSFYDNEFYNFGWTGVYLEGCSQGTLRSNNYTTCLIGLHIEQSNNILVEENLVNNSAGGIDVYYDCEYITVFNNTIINNDVGIGLYLGSRNNLVDSNNCTSSLIAGIYIQECAGNEVRNNHGRSNNIDIYLVNCTSHSISGNDCANGIADFPTLFGSITLQNSNSSSITNNTIYNSSLCIDLIYSSSYNEVSENNCTLFVGGIVAWYNVSHNEIFNNTCDGEDFADVGVYVEEGQHNWIFENRCNQSMINIAVINGNHTAIFDNECHDCEYELYMVLSYDILIEGNIFGVSLTGLYIDECNLVSILDNTITNATGAESSGIYLDQSVKCTVKGNHLVGNEYAIYIRQSEDCDINDNTCIDGYLGIVVEESNEIHVEDNYCHQMQDFGIVVEYSSLSTVTRNTCTNISGSSGICLGLTNAQIEVSYNVFSLCLGGISANWVEGVITHNTIENCTNIGLHIMGSLEANVTWNIFADNGENAQGDSGTTLFDYNYWSNYTGIDANADGIGDTWHPIDGTANSNDTHPLMYHPTLPSWLEEPTDQDAEYGEGFTYSLSVIMSSKLAPISEWWINNSHFIIDDGFISNDLALDLGEYPLKVRAYNLYGFYISGTFTVTVADTIAPTIIGPDDFDYIVGQVGRVITWLPEDRAPASYIVTLDGIEVMSGAWNSTTENITINVDGLSVGDHNFVFKAIDTSGNTATDAVIVTVRPADFTPLFIVIGAGGIVVAIIIVVYLVRKKSAS
jgi:parallel beta-helix repeat protein